MVYSIGFVAKLLAERIEEIDFGQVEAMRSAGAGFIATLAYAVMPHHRPGLGIYQLDSNLRASAVVGIVVGRGSVRPSPTPLVAMITTLPCHHHGHRRRDPRLRGGERFIRKRIA